MRWRAFKIAMPPTARWAWLGTQVAFGGEPGVAFGGDEAAAHRLHLDRQIDEVLDRLVVFYEPHCMGQGERKAEGELRLRQPAIEVVPDQPADDGLGDSPNRNTCSHGMNTSSSHIWPSSSS